MKLITHLPDIAKAVVPLLVVSLLVAGPLQSNQMSNLPESQVMMNSAYDFSDTVELLTAAIEEQNLMVVKEIDAQKMLRMVNMRVGGMKQLLFFHPRYMKRIMETNPQGTIEPPLKIAIMERPDGKVVVNTSNHHRSWASMPDLRNWALNWMGS